ncbi:MAG TPA: ribokinase, partial [Opitutaceae bacterium]|nr:ribokinase [Opitutaceae bacterium]
TGTAGILVSATGENAIVVALGANAHLQSRDLKRAWLENAKIVIAQCESNLTATLAALKVARRAGALTLLNPAPMRDDFDPDILRWVDVLIPNETEFVSLQQRIGAPVVKKGKPRNDLARLSSVEMQRRCRSFGVETVIVTLGSQGCVLSRPEKATALPGFKVDAVDTTGAGDAFVGGFAAGLLQHPGDLLAATHYAMGVAALSVTRVGTAPAMPWKREVKRFLLQQRQA